MFLKKHAVQDLSATQAILSLSSGVSELSAMVRAYLESVYVKHALEELGHEVETHIWTDTTAGTGIMNRLGQGKRRKHIHQQ